MAHQNRRAHWLVTLGGCALFGLLNSCGGAVEHEAAPRTKAAKGVQALNGPAMIVYSPNQAVDASTLVPLGSPESLGGEVLEGSPVLSGRVDYNERGMMAGLFKATTGRIRIVFPFTEHATILEGQVILTDESGQTRTFKPGDSYFIRQGQVILWDVKGPAVLKSFFNFTEPAPQ